MASYIVRAVVRRKDGGESFVTAVCELVRPSVWHGLHALATNHLLARGLDVAYVESIEANLLEPLILKGGRVDLYS